MGVRPGYKQTELGVIPEDWEVRPLSSTVRKISRGASPRPIDSPKWFDATSHVGWVRIADVTRAHRYLNETEQRLSDAGVHSSRFVPRGSLVMSICATVGRPIETCIDTCIHDGFVVFDKPIVDQSFLYHVLTRLEPTWSARGQTGSQMNLNTGLINSRNVALPPTEAETHAIATALSDADELLEGLDRLIAKKRNLKQAAMQQLLTGKVRLPGFDGEWQMRRLGDFADTDPENLSSETKPNFSFKYIALEDVDRGLLRSYTEQRFATAPSRARRKLRSDDILVATVRPNLQSHLLFRGEGDDWVCSTGFCVVRARAGISCPTYIFFQLFAQEVTRQIEALLTGSNYPAISSGDVGALEILMPCFAEQVAIAAVLSDMDAELRALEARRQKMRDVKQAMMQELLTGKTRLLQSEAVNA